MSLLSSTSTDAIRLLDNVDQPPGLIVEVVHEPAKLFERKVTLNKPTSHLFGSAMRQGRRLQFVTTMPLSNYLDLTRIDRAQKGMTVEELREHKNRPKIPSQQTAIRDYLGETGCVGEKFIFPSFMINFGSEWSEEKPQAKLTILATDTEALCWPAVFEPSGEKMPSTDGAHRTQTIKDMVDKGANDEGIRALLANGVGVTIVMEADNDDAHQDFADCGKAKAIADSIVSTFDKRHIVVAAARELVKINPFLAKFVDATSPSVNLSSNSTKVWSMSAVRGALTSGIPGFKDLTAADKKKALVDHPKQVSDFLCEVVDNVDLLGKLDRGEATPAAFRKQDRGGCVILRGVGFGMLMRIYCHAMAKGFDPLKVAKKLNKVDWFVLKPDAEPEPSDADKIHGWLTTAAQPHWLRMLAVNQGTGSYRVKGTVDNIEAAFGDLQPILGL